MQMQMELEDSDASKRLLTFVESNRVLLNMLLRHKVHLLDSSFSLLALVPRCRHLLHFDVKRAFFKSKIKKLRSANPLARNHSLRLDVRRQFVFEDSFNKLRYKPADELRKRLAVSFVNEEGLDAGGVTREWYTVLAREIFNPNYALFTCTTDNITFQPNGKSDVNPDHLGTVTLIYLLTHSLTHSLIRLFQICWANYWQGYLRRPAVGCAFHSLLLQAHSRLTGELS